MAVNMRSRPTRDLLTCFGGNAEVEPISVLEVWRSGAERGALPQRGYGLQFAELFHQREDLIGHLAAGLIVTLELPTVRYEELATNA